jgi:hypothetical protein
MASPRLPLRAPRLTRWTAPNPNDGRTLQVNRRKAGSRRAGGRPKHARDFPCARSRPARRSLRPRPPQRSPRTRDRPSRGRVHHVR